MSKFRFHGFAAGTIAVVCAGALMLVMDQVGIVEAESLRTPARIFHVVRVVLVVYIFIFSMESFVRLLEKTFEGDWSLLVVHRKRLLLWYLLIEMLFHFGSV